MLHEISLERRRLREEQTSLERLASGLMIDLQSSLLASDDSQVIVAAPEGAPRPAPAAEEGAPVPDAPRSGGTGADGAPPPPTAPSLAGHAPPALPPRRQPPPEPRATPSRSPRQPGGGRPPAASAGAATRAPPAPVNFRTGLSGHRGLSSAYTHPHDFIKRRQGRW